MEKVMFSFEVEKILKDSFLRIAKANDRTASQILRDMMREYVTKNGQLKMKAEK